MQGACALERHGRAILPSSGRAAAGKDEGSNVSVPVGHRLSKPRGSLDVGAFDDAVIIWNDHTVVPPSEGQHAIGHKLGH